MPDRRRGFEEKSEQERERREEMEEEKRLALLIDADNVSPKYIGVIMKEAQGYGNVTIRKIRCRPFSSTAIRQEKILLTRR